jgi:L-threonylcarbamoyladenylate synthase
MSVPILPATPENIQSAARALRAGRLVAFPTETVYGLGAIATSDAAVAAIFAAKGRPSFNPLICHVPDLEGAKRLADFDSNAVRLARAFWPGPLTLVLPNRADNAISRLVGAGLPTLALRAPAHPVALALLAATGQPLAAPSANPSGQLSPTLATHVAQSLGQSAQGNLAMIVDGGPCQVGLESTIVGLAGPAPTLLRPGAISRAAIEALIGPLIDPPAGIIQAPGMTDHHYAPKLPLRLNATGPAGGREALLAFGPGIAPELENGFGRVLNLSPQGNLAEAGANLYAYLHALDDPRFEGIAVMAVPEIELGVAINDRLRRAATTASG